MVVAMIAILVAIALPSYASYMKKSRVRTAAGDLAALGLNMDNKLQLQLSYPVYAADTAATTTLFPGWSPAMGQYFSYKIQSTASAYTLKAIGQGSLNGCTLTLESSGSRTGTSACGISTW